MAASAPGPMSTSWRTSARRSSKREMASVLVPRLGPAWVTDALSEYQRFPVKARTGKRPRRRTQLRTASSAKQGQNSRSSGAQTAAVSCQQQQGCGNSSGRLLNHVQLQRPGHKLLFVRCRDSGRQFSVNGSCTVTLWPQAQLPHNAQLVNFTLTSASSNKIPTFDSTTQKLNLGGQLFSHTLGRDCLAELCLVENYSGRFLTQIQIPAVNNRKHQAGHINQVKVDQRVKNILQDFSTAWC